MRVKDIDIEAPPKLKRMFKTAKRFKVAFGGRGGAKSVSFANYLSICAANAHMVGCFREFQTSIDDSVFALLVNQIRTLGMTGFEILKTHINHLSGGGFRFKGLARSIEAVKSMHGFKRFWLEEGQFISDDSLRILTPTLRESGSELWISANPLNSADPFAQRFIVPYLDDIERHGYYEDDLHLIVKMNYSHNPWFKFTALEQERIFDFEHLPRAVYDHIWEGAFNDTVDDSIIPADWFDAAIDAHKKLGFEPRGAVVVSHDPSDTGADDKGLVVRHGSVIVQAEARSIGDVNEGCDWALDQAIRYGADLFVWDADGMGIGLKRNVESALKGKKIDFKLFHGAEQAEHPNTIYEPLEGTNAPTKKQKTNAELFRNRRAQFYWKLRDRFYASYLAVVKGKYIDPDKMISISSDCKNIRAMRSEVCRIPRKYNSQGTIQIMTKKEMEKLKIKSPNIADSMMMSLCEPEIVTDFGPMNFETYY